MENKMSSEDTSYVELQKKIDESTPAGFPASEDGTEIQILKLMFNLSNLTPIEIELLL